MKKVHESTNLDDIIAAHEAFLDYILSSCLIDNQSKVSHLLNVVSCILQKLRSGFYYLQFYNKQKSYDVLKRTIDMMFKVDLHPKIIFLYISF